MSTKLNAAGRMTISLPKHLLLEIDEVRKDLNIPKSEVCKIAIEKFLEEQRKSKLAKIAAMMVEEYDTDDELTSFTSLDGEKFK